jgi:hypothetical protein
LQAQTFINKQKQNKGTRTIPTRGVNKGSILFQKPGASPMIVKYKKSLKFAALSKPIAFLKCKKIFFLKRLLPTTTHALYHWIGP